jgi:carboxymethylenebutenolidase
MKTRLKVLARATMLASIVTWLAACQSADKPAAAVVDTPGGAPVPPKPQPPAAAPAPAPASAPAVAVLEQDVAYGEGRKSNLVGYLAMPQDAAEPLPGVIVIHERWGLNDDIKAITRRLAAQGYVALAVDLYGGETATTPEKAQQLMTEFADDAEGARRNVSQAYDYLEKYALAPRIGSIGWDLGAGWSLQTALLFPDGLDAMVMYYGSPIDDPEQLAKLKMPMLGFFGSEDKSVPVRDVQAFRNTLNELGKNADVLIMVGEDHGFASPGSPAYKESVANESWVKTLQFLERNLKVPLPPR